MGRTRQKGRITHWNAERGFGFVTPVGGGERVFLHISAIADRRRPPAEGDMVTYDTAFDERKRPRAVGVKPSILVSQKAQTASRRASGSVPLMVASLFVLFLIVETLAGRLPLMIIVIYGTASAVTFLAYWIDKSAAQHGHWRTKESSLLLLGLVGGWPGAVVAQRSLRHKSRKESFQWTFWVTVVMNSAALVWFLTQGSDIIAITLERELPWPSSSSAICLMTSSASSSAAQQSTGAVLSRSIVRFFGPRSADLAAVHSPRFSQRFRMWVGTRTSSVFRTTHGADGVSSGHGCNQ